MKAVKEAWFDTGTGRLAIGEPAVEQLVQEVGHMALPLADVLLAPEFPYVPGEFPRPRSKDFSPEDGIAVGIQISQMLRQTESAKVLSKEIVRRANILGILPDKNYIERNYGSFGNFAAETGLPYGNRSSMFNDMPLSELFQTILSSYQKHAGGQPMSMQKLQELYKSGLVPHYDYVLQRFGGISPFKEHLGYPDVHTWDDTDYIFYGVRVLRCNGPSTLTMANIDKLARQRHGPYKQAVLNRFHKWEKFKQLCESELQQQDEMEAERLAKIQKHFTEIDYGEVKPQDASRQRIVWASYELAAKCLPTSAPATLIRLSLIPTPGILVNEIYRRRRGLSRAEIELAAVELNIADELWPPPPPLRQPILPPKSEKLTAAASSSQAVLSQAA